MRIKLTGTCISLSIAALLGFCFGRRDTAPIAPQLADRSEAIVSTVSISPAPTRAVTRPPLVHTAPVAIANPDPVSPEAQPAAAANTEELDPDGVPQEVQSLIDAHEQFRAWLEAHPDRGQTETVQWLKSVPEGEWNLSSMVFETITATGNDGARQAVASVLQNPSEFAPTIVLQAAQAAGDLAGAAPAGLQTTLRQLIESSNSPESAQLADAALYSLARLAREDEVNQQFIVERLRPALGSGRSPEEAARALSFLTMAEASDPALLGQAERLARSDNQELQAAARDYIDRIRPEVADVE